MLTIEAAGIDRTAPVLTIEDDCFEGMTGRTEHDAGAMAIDASDIERASLAGS